jgi:hypothetical protein
MLSDVDLALLPTMFEEEIISRFAGGNKHVPCCPSSPSYYCEKLFNTRWVDTKPQGYLFKFTGPLSGLSFAFAKCISCFTRPVRRRNDGIVTTHTMYYISSGPSSLDPFFLTWVPIRALKGFTTSVRSYGAHPYANCSCCCYTRKALVKKGGSRYDMQIRTDEGFSMPFSYNIPFHNWLEDEQYTKMVAIMGAVDVRLNDI